MKMLGIVLIVLGVIGLGYGGINWTHQKKVVDLGPLEVTHDKTESIPIPPILGGVCLVAGLLVVLGDRRRT